MRLTRLSLGLVIIVMAAPAGIIEYFDETSFAGAVAGTLTVEDFTSTSHFTIPSGFLNSFTDLPAIGPYPGDILPGVTYSTNVDSNSSSSDEFNIDGGGGGFVGGFLDSLNLGSSRPLTVTFVSPVQGFGFDTNGALGGTTQIVQIGDVSFTLSLPDSEADFFLDSSAMLRISAASP
jgi:hypothetical protein